LENGNASDGAGATAEITMTPKRLTAYIDVSKTLLDQTSFDMQQFLIDDIKNAIAAKLDASILDATASSSTRPAGLLNGVATTLVTTSFAEVVAMEAAVDTANALQGKLAYITHPNVKQLMKTTAKLSNGAAIMEGDMANGYPVLVSSAIPTGATTSKGIIYGNWNDLIIGQWGGLDIIIDPYTQAIAGKVRLIVNANFNWAKVRTDSFTAKYLG
jgi:HK97 family phage major capsid protein